MPTELMYLVSTRLQEYKNTRILGAQAYGLDRSKLTRLEGCKPTSLTAFNFERPPGKYVTKETNGDPISEYYNTTLLQYYTTTIREA